MPDCWVIRHFSGQRSAKFSQLILLGKLDSSFDIVTPIGILGQVWCLIVSIPDLCTLSYFDSFPIVGNL